MLKWEPNETVFGGDSICLVNGFRLGVWQIKGTGLWSWFVSLEESSEVDTPWLGLNDWLHSEEEAQQAAETALHEALLETLKAFE